MVGNFEYFILSRLLAELGSSFELERCLEIVLRKLLGCTAEAGSIYLSKCLFDFVEPYKDVIDVDAPRLAILIVLRLIAELGVRLHLELVK